jgi:hypothetical protein
MLSGPDAYTDYFEGAERMTETLTSATSFRNASS